MSVFYSEIYVMLRCDTQVCFSCICLFIYSYMENKYVFVRQPGVLQGDNIPSLGSSHPLHQHPASCPHRRYTSPPPVPQGSRERARVRNCVGMAVCVIEGVGPLGASGELHEFVMSAMLAMAYWTGEEQRIVGKKKTDRERPRPGPARLSSRCYPQSTDWLLETVTDSSMRTRGRAAVIPSRSNRFMLHLLI